MQPIQLLSPIVTGAVTNFPCPDAAGNAVIMVVVVNFRIRADLHALADHDAFHAVDADAITKRRIAADLQRTAVHGQ